MDQLLRSYNSKQILDGYEAMSMVAPPYSKRYKDAPPGKRNKLRLKIGNRDGWICQLCKQQIVYQDESSLDHIVAVANGGTDAQVNLQIAHKKCNSLKGHHPQREPEYYITQGKIASKRKQHRLENAVEKKRHRELGIAKVTPFEMNGNPASDLWNEVVKNQFQNLSYEIFLSAFEKYAAIKIKLLGLKAPPKKGANVYYNGTRECLFFGNDRCAYCGGKRGTEAVEKCKRDIELEYQ